MDAFYFALDSIVNRLIRPVLVALSLIVAGLIVTGIITRSILAEPLFGVEEVVLLSVMWLYMLGAVMAAKERSHLRADFLPTLIQSETALAALQLLASIISLLMATAFVVWSFDLFQWSLTRQQSTPVFAVPWAVSQTAPFICSVLMSVYVFRDVVRDARLYKAAGGV